MSTTDPVSPVQASRLVASQLSQWDLIVANTSAGEEPGPIKVWGDM